jgi:hypothetical protein
MSDITKKFDEFKAKKIKEFGKTKEFDTLSDDIIALKELEDGSIEKIKGPIEIVRVTGIIIDDEKIKKLDEIAGGPVLNTDLSLKQVKRGQLIWITCLLQKPSSSAVYNTQTMGVIRARIVDFYYGLNILNTVKQ